MNKKIVAGIAAVGVFSVVGISSANAAPTYDNPYDIQTAKRVVLKAYYKISLSSQRGICSLYEYRTVYVVRQLGRTAYRNTPDRVSLREAQKGVIYALASVC